MPKTCLARDTILHVQQHIIMNKAHRKFQPDWLEFFLENAKKVTKCEESDKMHK